MTVKTNTFIVIPPWETIEEKLRDLCMSVEEFRIRMGMEEQDVVDLIKGKYYIDSRFAKKLEYVLGTPQSFWINLEKNYMDKLWTYDKAEWIDADESKLKCSYCEELVDKPTPFCPYCGCSMNSPLE